MKKKVIIASSIVGGILIYLLISLIISGYIWGIKPFGFLRNIRLRKLEGNAEKYDVENIEELENSPLKGKNILYLGSSVTFGASSLETSFVEYIAKRNNTTYLKEAVSGTTLVEEGNSYIKRLQEIDKNQEFDLFVCQLSTNDATKNKTIGNISDTQTNTICGAINFIIDYAKETWNCPVIFYTNAYYQNDNYSKMVVALNEISTNKDIYVADLYSNKDFNNITSDQRKLYMEDKIHPTKAGYLEWWTPEIEKTLYKVYSK